MNKQMIEKAIKYIHNIMTETDIYCGQSKKMSEEDKEYLEMLQIVVNSMRQQLTNGWIPVSERLPEEGRYLVTTVYGEVKESEFDLKKWWQIDNSTISLEWEEEPIKVVAWRKLPEPYKEVSE